MKYKAESPGYQRYGPYALVDRTTRAVVATNLNADAVERELCAPG